MLKRRTAASHFETHWELEDQDRVDFSTFSYRISKVPARLEIIDDNQKRYSFRWTDCSLIESPHHEFISMIFTDKTVAITGEYLHTMMARDADSLVHPSLWASLNAQSTVRIAPSRGESVGANRTHCISNILIEDRK